MDQGKTCMVKAILPEPQFAAANNVSGVAGWLTRHIGEMEERALSSSRASGHAASLPASPAHPL